MYSLELSLRYSPFPISIQKKDYGDIKSIYDGIKESMKNNNSELIELKCEKILDKLISVKSEEIIAVQLYEKSSSSGGAKRPGFSFDG
tara:strand:- start:281 stop:544 length:264 start_codon:yes stop_codon:yes gene_type:complete